MTGRSRSRGREIYPRRLRELLNYDPETGALTWRMSRGRGCTRVNAGDVAGSITAEGYRQIGIDGRPYPAHRLAWMYTHGRWPEYHLDHVNGIRDDNRIENLRDTELPTENQQNQRLSSVNTSGFPGVSWSKASGKWVAQITVYGKRHHLGLFHDLEEAALAYRDAKKKHHKFCPEVRSFDYDGPVTRELIRADRRRQARGLRDSYDTWDCRWWDELTEEDVLTIRFDYALGADRVELARTHGVFPRTVTDIVHRWKHLELEHFKEANA